jgi:hypothetical protein
LASVSAVGLIWPCSWPASTRLRRVRSQWSRSAESRRFRRCLSACTGNAFAACAVAAPRHLRCRPRFPARRAQRLAERHARHEAAIAPMPVDAGEFGAAVAHQLAQCVAHRGAVEAPDAVMDGARRKRRLAVPGQRRAQRHAALAAVERTVGTR